MIILEYQLKKNMSKFVCLLACTLSLDLQQGKAECNLISITNEIIIPKLHYIETVESKCTPSYLRLS